MKKFATSLIFACLGLAAIAQNTFTNNKEKFVKELQSAVGAYSDQGEFFKKNLLPQLLSNEINDQTFEAIVNTSNQMITKRLKAYPEVFNYVYSLSEMVRIKSDSETIKNFQAVSDQIIASKSYKRIEDFVDFTASYLSEQVLTNSSGTKWVYRNGKLSLGYKGDKLQVSFTNGTLACLIENTNRQTNKDNPYLDSIVIENTNGTYDPMSKKWEGNGGKVSWEKVGLDKKTTFAILKSYNETLRSATFTCDTVILTTPYFTTTIQGRFSDRASRTTSNDNSYPKFNSFVNVLKIPNIKKDMDYIGGFSLSGPAFIGIGTSSEPANIIVRENNKKFIKVSASMISVDKDKVVAQKSKIAIYTNDKDSITHPGLDFRYTEASNTFDFTRTKTSSGQAPFTNSFNKVLMYVPKISWIRGSDQLELTYEFGTSQEQRIARLDSEDFYDSQQYEQLQGMNGAHPLVALSKYFYKYDLKVISEANAATALDRVVQDAIPILLNLNSLGFINYDTEAKTVSATQKLVTFVAAKSGTKDYDNLSFISDLRPQTLNQYTPEQVKADKRLQAAEASNKKINEERRNLKNFGFISLKTHSIQLFAVDQVMISEPQMTSVFPNKSEVLIRQGRDFIFNGWVNAGKLEVNALEASYSYAENKITLEKTSESLFKVRPLKKEDAQSLIVLNSSISGLKGDIKVDHPTNRSGKSTTISAYPILTTTNSSRVYYQHEAIQKNAYDSTRFYFTLQPFTLDSLDNFKEASLAFDGELISGGIFPKFKEKLKIMPDYSLGFSTVAPKEGYDFYSTGAKYDNKIILSNNGLQGAGKIDFMKSTSISKAFTFMPDSTVGVAQFTNLGIETGIQYPDVKGEDVWITYVPKAGILKAKSSGKHLSFFNDQAKLNGTAIVSKNGMRGLGNMSFKTANLSSYNFRFERWDIKADTSNFALKNMQMEGDEDPLSFKTDNVSSDVSFKSRKGKFVSNQGESRVTFPVNQYLCKMDIIDWMMDSEDIELSSNQKQNISIDANLDLAQNNFFSLHPKQDSLQFRAPKAIFNLKEKTIYCSNTEYIDVADARIFPSDKKVTIRKKAVMDKLENSSIIANYITKYHRYVEASTQINGRKSYASVGKYPYKDADSNVTLVKVDRIYLDSSFQTVGIGKIEQEAKFKLSPQFDYYGNFKIAAANPLIQFTGATRINHECEKFPQSWMSFASQIDPKNIQIPVSPNMKTLDGKSISAGIVWQMSEYADSIQLYPAFLSELKSAKDPIVITSSGFLQYKSGMKEYQIASREKLDNASAKGDFVALNTATCSMKGIGKINLGVDYGEVKVAAIGVANYNQERDETTLNITAKYELPLDKSTLEAVADRIAKTEGLKGANLNVITLEQAILEWVDQKAADKFKEDYIVKNDVRKVPKELENGMVVSGLKLKSFNPSNSGENGFITESNEAFLVNFYDKPIMKMVPFKAAFLHANSQENSGNSFAFHINPPMKEYLFDYRMSKKDGEMKIYTSDAELINSLTSMKDDKRKSKNFKYEITTNTLYLTKLLELFTY